MASAFVYHLTILSPRPQGSTHFLSKASSPLPMLPEQDADQVESKVNPSALLTPEVILIPTQDTSQELASVDTPKQQTPEDTLDTGFGGYMKERRAKLAVQAPAPS